MPHVFLLNSAFDPVYTHIPVKCTTSDHLMRHGLLCLNTTTADRVSERRLKAEETSHKQTGIVRIPTDWASKIHKGLLK